MLRQEKIKVYDVKLVHNIDYFEPVIKLSSHKKAITNTLKEIDEVIKIIYSAEYCDGLEKAKQIIKDNMR